MVVFNFALCSQANLVPFDNLRARNSSRLSYRVAERYQCAVSRVLTVWQTHRALDAAEREADGLRGSKGMPFDESVDSGRRYGVGARNDHGRTRTVCQFCGDFSMRLLMVCGVGSERACCEQCALVSCYWFRILGVLSLWRRTSRIWVLEPAYASGCAH